MRTWKPMQRDNSSIQTVLDLALSFERSRVLLTACELDLFSVIGAKVKPADEISAQLDTDEKATARLLNALVAIGLIEKNDNGYLNSKISLRFFDKTKPEYIGLFKYQNYLWNLWGNLTKTVKQGKPPDIMDIKDMTKDQISPFIEAINWRSSILAHDVIRLLDLSKVNKLLDLAGGLGNYTIEFLNLKPELDASLFDYPNIIPFTEEYLKSEGFNKKINLMKGDFRTDNFGTGYDMVFISFAMHHVTLWENIQLCNRIYDALKPGGKLIIHDYLINDNRISPEYNALLSIEMLVSSNGGDVYTETDYWIMLKESWFENIQRIDTDFGTALISASR
ncbi:MAG: methyltransferase domain-containing protein [Ignavibacteriae bacterium]|nr:methyltransferase domain-containing protein [Ignavibacteriota bacterium]